MRRSILLIACLTAGCAHPSIQTATPARPRTDALVVLPGFGYTGAGERAFRELSPAVVRDGFDLYVPSYISRSGIAASRRNLAHYLREQHLERYERVHVFAFIAGAWTFNPLTDANL